jgi:hypothetical protein
MQTRHERTRGFTLIELPEPEPTDRDTKETEETA